MPSVPAHLSFADTSQKLKNFILRKKSLEEEIERIMTPILDRIRFHLENDGMEFEEFKLWKPVDFSDKHMTDLDVWIYVGDDHDIFHSFDGQLDEGWEYSGFYGPEKDCYDGVLVHVCIPVSTLVEGVFTSSTQNTPQGLIEKKLILALQ